MVKFEKGEIIKGKVTGIEDYGIFLSLDDNYAGLIHISEMSLNFVKNIFDYVQLNEVIRARVLDVDEVNKKVKLSIKNLDYRIDSKKKLEDKNGFSPLRRKLPEWINEYMQRMRNEVK